MFKKFLSLLKVEKDLFEKMVRETYEDSSPETVVFFLKFKKEDYDYSEVARVVEEPSEDRRFEMVAKFNRLRSISSVGNGSYQNIYLPSLNMGVKIFESGKITLSIRRLN